jgi:hypothetical protein
MLQRRRWERCRKELPVVIDRGGPEQTASTTIDICEGGLGLLSPRAFEAGSRIRFAIADLAEGEMNGIVRWCTPSKPGGGHIVGVELDALSAAHRDSLADKLALWRSQAADEDG